MADELIKPDDKEPVKEPATDDDPAKAKTAIQFDDTQQTFIDNLIADRLKRDREKRGKELQTQQEQVQKDAEAAKLLEQQEFQKLADTYKTERDTATESLTSLTAESGTLKEQLTAANEALTNYAKSRIEAVPELFRPLVEGLPVLEQLQWLTKNADKLTTNGKISGPPTTPKPTGRGEMTHEERQRKAARTF